MKATAPKSAGKIRRGAKQEKSTKPEAAAGKSAPQSVAKAPQVKAKEQVSADARPPALKKLKTVRDSFNMPAEDHALIGMMKQRAHAQAVPVKKSELLRAGLRLLAALSDEVFMATLAAVPAVKTGRPGKEKK